MSLVPRPARGAAAASALILALTPAAPPAHARAASDVAATDPTSQSDLRSSGRVFPFLSLYYRLSPERRSLFGIAYKLEVKDAPGAVRAVLIDGGEEPLPQGAGGWFDRLPTAEQLGRHPKVRVEWPMGTKLDGGLAPEARVALGAEIAPAEIAAALAQLNNGLHAAGPLVNIAIPKFNRVLFPGARGAVAVDMAGRERPLRLHDGTPMLKTLELGDLRVLRFARAPERVLLVPS